MPQISITEFYARSLGSPRDQLYPKGQFFLDVETEPPKEDEKKLDFIKEPTTRELIKQE